MRSVADALSNNDWIQDVTSPRASPMMMQFVLIYQWLQQVILNQEVEDKLIWRWDSSGMYNAASTYKAMFLGQTSILGAREVWKIKAPNKCRFFAWLIVIGRNWTSERQWCHGLPDGDVCALCA
jgi:hypothetical protein